MNEHGPRMESLPNASCLSTRRCYTDLRSNTALVKARWLQANRSRDEFYCAYSAEWVMFAYDAHC